MTRNVLLRLAQLVPVMIGVSMLTFFLLAVLPGDPAVAVLGQEADPAALEAFRQEYGLDRPVVVRYLDWAASALTGDFGVSTRTKEPVIDMILARLPVSAEIAVLALLIALALSVPVALASALHVGSWFDRIANATAFAGLSAPHFLLGLVLIQFVAVDMQWLPATGWVSWERSWTDNLASAALPALTLSLSAYAIFMRLLRSDLIETLKEDYVLTALSKGISRSRLLLRHVLRNSLVALITVAGVTMGNLISGAVITETVFAVPGLGALLIDSIYSRDQFTVQGIVLFVALIYVVVNLVVDILYAVVDPRIRFRGAV